MFDSSLAGRIVVVQTKPELIEKDPKAYSDYYDGEYFVLRASEQSLACVKIAPGYDGARTRSFLATRYDVIEAYDDDVLIEDWLEEHEYFAKAPERGEKLRWIEGVYSDAASIVRQAQRVHERRLKALDAEGSDRSDEVRAPKVEACSFVYTYNATFRVRGTVEDILKEIDGAMPWRDKRFVTFTSFLDGQDIRVSPHAITAVSAAV